MITSETRPRSYLFVPGDRPDRFEKALASGADAVIIDLEDAVPAALKERARENARQWLSPDKSVYVRTNGPTTEWFNKDVEAVLRPGLRGIVLPKAEIAGVLVDLRSRLPDGVTVIPIVESAVGVWNALALAAAPGVERLAFGSVDFQLDTGIQGEGDELLYARSHVVLASRVAGVLAPIDGVTTALDDQDVLAADVDRARRLGFGGKLLVHPRQVEITNSGFGPSLALVRWAERVIVAAEEAGGKVIRLDGEMLDQPVIERARRILGTS